MKARVFIRGDVFSEKVSLLLITKDIISAEGLLLSKSKLPMLFQHTGGLYLLIAKEMPIRQDRTIRSMLLMLSCDTPFSKFGRKP